MQNQNSSPLLSNLSGLLKTNGSKPQSHQGSGSQSGDGSFENKFGIHTNKLRGNLTTTLTPNMTGQKSSTIAMPKPIGGSDKAS
jgi:hypothetical protein